MGEEQAASDSISQLLPFSPHYDNLQLMRFNSNYQPEFPYYGSFANNLAFSSPFWSDDNYYYYPTLLNSFYEQFPSVYFYYQPDSDAFYSFHKKSYGNVSSFFPFISYSCSFMLVLLLFLLFCF